MPEGFPSLEAYPIWVKSSYLMSFKIYSLIMGNHKLTYTFRRPRSDVGKHTNKTTCQYLYTKTWRRGCSKRYPPCYVRLISIPVLPPKFIHNGVHPSSPAPTAKGHFVKTGLPDPRVNLVSSKQAFWKGMNKTYEHTLR